MKQVLTQIDEINAIDARSRGDAQLSWSGRASGRGPPLSSQFPFLGLQKAEIGCIPFSLVRFRTAISV